ncbi:MAG: Bifunctional ligase/repressor BirA [Firmicutes bacterium ADurb.Bin193]|nr:MAG: Bifunctional ligase/repressor BirA [Firmicutes bacterium ADurb.Bin193]
MYNILRFEDVTSTNDVLKTMNAPCGTVAVAKRQSAGKGRNGRIFSSPEGGLYFSVVLEAQEVSDRLFIPIRAAAAVCAALSKHTECAIKWSNDILSKGKKICGILAESSGKSVVLGIGINLAAPQSYFTENGLSDASSVFALTGKMPDGEGIMNDILSRLAENAPKHEVMSYYRQNCITLGKRVRVIKESGEYTAKAVDLDESGRLVVLKDGGYITVNSGEVSIRA